MKIYKCTDLKACGLKHDLHNYFIKAKIAAKTANGKEIKDAFINTSLIDPELFNEYILKYKRELFDVYLETEGIIDNVELFGIFQEILDLDDYNFVKVSNIKGYDNLVKIYLTSNELLYFLVEKRYLRNVKEIMKNISERALKDYCVHFDTIEYPLVDALSNAFRGNANIEEARQYLAENYNHSSYSDKELLEFGKICSLIRETNKTYQNYSDAKSNLSKEIYNYFSV